MQKLKDKSWISVLVKLIIFVGCIAAVWYILRMLPSDTVTSIIPFGFIFLFIAICVGPVRKLQRQINAVIKNPTEESVTTLMKHIERIIMFRNHPARWQNLRSLWNVVNRSDKVTTPTKEKFIAMLQAKGLIVNNVKINDNYKGTES